ncbi:MAG: hypothetical protein WC455_24985 [Dehalococcoidia bacterium]|jgi:hypothetical protein
MYENEARFYNLEMDVKDNTITRINAKLLHVTLLEPKPLRWDGDKPVYREPRTHRR